MMMKNLLAFLLFFTCALLQAQDFSFLEGTWKVADKDVYESWALLEDGSLKGKAYTLEEGNKKIAETLDLRKTEGKWSYYATVIGQNNNLPIGFKLNLIDDNTYSFENQTHDFPKKIIYQREDDTTLSIRVLGKSDEGFDYKMEKISSNVKTSNNP